MKKSKLLSKKSSHLAKGYEPNKNNQIDVPDFPIIDSNCFTKQICLGTKDMIKAFEEIYFIPGEKNTKTEEYGYYMQVKKRKLRRINGNDSVDLIRKAIFNKEIPKSKIGPTILGLPLVYQMIDKEKTRTGDGIATINNNTGRKASPLHITFHKKTDGNYYCYLLLIPSKISEDKPILDAKTKENSKNRNEQEREFKIIGNEDFEELQRFINESFEDKAGGSNGGN